MLRRVYDLIHLADRGRFAPWRRLPVDHNLISVGRVGRVGRRSSPVLRLLGVKYVLRHDRPGGPPGFRRDLRWRVRALPDPLPRAFVVHRTRLVTDPAARARLMRSFDPGRLAVVESAAARLPSAGSDSVPPDGQAAGRPALRDHPAGRRGGPEGTQDRVEVTHRSRCTGAADLRVSISQAGLLVFTEAWHPGWRATVDGEPVPVHRVDHALIGLRLPPGKHQVRLRFDPPSLTWGALVSGASLLALLALVLLSWLRRREPSRTSGVPPAGAP
jgi:hypothetical protein